MEIPAERKKRIEKLREQLPFLNKYQKESQNEELKKHSRYIMNLFSKASKEGKDINIPDHKIDLLIASVEKLKEYTENAKSLGYSIHGPRTFLKKVESVKRVVKSSSPEIALDGSSINEREEAVKPMTENVKKIINTPAPETSLAGMPKNIKEEEIVKPTTELPATLNTSSSESSLVDSFNRSNKERRQEKELKRLQENIVKDPLPSRRTIKRNSRYLDSNKDATASTAGESQSPNKRKSDTEKSVEMRYVKSSRSLSDLPSLKSPEFTTSTPKLPKVMPSRHSNDKTSMKRKSDISAEKLSSEEKVPPLKISLLAKKAAENSKEIPTVLPAKKIDTRSESPATNLRIRKVPSKSDVKTDVSEDERFKLKKIVLKSPMSADRRKPTVVEETKNISDDSRDVSEQMDIDTIDSKTMDSIVSHDGEIKEERKFNRKDIENMGYVAVRGGFIFQCIAEDCFFNTMKKFSFINHLEENHNNVMWSGQCKVCCDETGGKQSSKEDEFWHMMEKHVHKENSDPESLPDIIELPKEELQETSKSETVNDKVVDVAKPQNKNASELKPSNEKITVENKMSRFMTRRKTIASRSEESDGKIKETTSVEQPQRITVRTFANVSNFSPPKGSQQLASSLKAAITKPIAKLMIQPKASGISRNDIRGENGCVKKPMNTLKALMQKQTEANLRRLQSAAKNAHIIPTIAPRTKEKTPEEPTRKPVKFFIKKPANDTEIKVPEEIKVPKDQSPKDLNLRPWLTRPVKKYLNRTVKLLAPHSLASTFKCMGAKCEFVHDDPKKFEAHLNNHVAATPGDIASYIVCPYCDFGDFTKTSVADLITHIQEEHGFDKYQCKYCFYRSCAHFNVIEHQKIHHRMQNHSIIMIDNMKSRDYKEETQKVKESCGKFIKPLICATCKLNKNEVKKFFVLKHYLNHLRAHEKNNELIKANCKKCGKLVDNAESLYLHMFECFENIALYQCAFCVFGTNLIDKIHDHLANCHPSKMSLICVRADNTPMKEGASQHEYQAASLKLLFKTVDESCIMSVEGETSAENTSSPALGIQIQNVYSLSSDK